MFIYFDSDPTTGQEAPPGRMAPIHLSFDVRIGDDDACIRLNVFVRAETCILDTYSCDHIEPRWLEFASRRGSSTADLSIVGGVHYSVDLGRPTGWASLCLLRLVAGGLGCRMLDGKDPITAGNLCLAVRYSCPCPCAWSHCRGLGELRDMAASLTTYPPLSSLAHEMR